MFNTIAIASLLVGATVASPHGVRLNERFVFEALVDGLETRDGEGVVVHRYLGGNEKIDYRAKIRRREACYLDNNGACAEAFPTDTQIRTLMDPFLVFDNYRSDDKTEYENGFPAHPHKGMLEIRHFTVGGLHHTDSCSRDKVTPPGGGQALFAGRGIIHEEKAVAMEGSNNDAEACGFKGFQLWINVPQATKKKAPNYRTVKQFPVVNVTTKIGSNQAANMCSGGNQAKCALTTNMAPNTNTTVRVIAGNYRGTFGPFTDMIRGGFKDEDGAKAVRKGAIRKETVKGFLYLDVTHRCASSNAPFVVDVPPLQNVLVYMYASASSEYAAPSSDSEISLADGMVVGSLASGNAAFVPKHSLAILGDGDHVSFSCPSQALPTSTISFVVVTAPPVKEKVFIANGFAMSTKEELDAAIHDFNNGQATWC